MYSSLGTDKITQNQKVSQEKGHPVWPHSVTRHLSPVAQDSVAFLRRNPGTEEEELLNLKSTPAAMR